MIFNEWYNEQIRTYIGERATQQRTIGPLPRVRKYAQEFAKYESNEYERGQKLWWAQRGARRDLVNILGIGLENIDMETGETDHRLLQLATVTLEEMEKREIQERLERKERWMRHLFAPEYPAEDLGWR